MDLEKYQIPKSYQSYLETFENDPEAAIKRLKKRVEKRNAGAVGYFFLAWLYMKAGDKDNALDASIQAKVMAPGSRLMSRLHYYISHPQAFEAWEPKKKRKPFKRESHSYSQAHPIHDLDLLISKLSSLESRRIKPNFDSKEKQQDLSEKSADVDDIVTETLAVIHEKQKNYPAAITTYQKLKEVNSAKSEYYDEQISRLQKKKGKENSDDE